MFSATANAAFDAAVKAYHIADDVDAPMPPYGGGTDAAQQMLYAKCWVDVVQWHLEDLIRDPQATPQTVVALKRRIDASNQDRTDRVERIDDMFLQQFASVEVPDNAPLNTETPAWAIDRLSILAVKLYHMAAEAARADATEEHRQRCAAKLNTLRQQRRDLSEAIDTLLDDLAAGRKRFRVYRQMKMYNDAATNPVLYAKTRV